MNELLKNKLLGNCVDESNELVTVSKLNRYFKKQGTYFKAVDDASFTINKQDFFGIIGESGSGKSTTGKMLIRLYPTSGGTIIFDKHLISQEKISKKTRSWLCQNMQMIFQDPMSSLNPKKNVLTLVSEPFKINHKLDKQASEIIKDHLKINKYFQYTYHLKDNEISHKFFDQYYNGLAKTYQEAIDKLKAIHININEDGNEELARVLDILADTEENAKKINFLVYDYTKEIKGIFDHCLTCFNNNEINANEINYFNSEKNYYQNKQEAKHCYDYLELKQLRDQKQQEYKTIKSNLKEWYYKENKMFINSLIGSYSLDLSAIKTAKSITKTNFEYYYQQAKQWKLELLVESLKQLKHCYWIELSEFQDYVKELENLIDQTVNPALELAVKMQAINNERLIFVDKAIEAYSFAAFQLSKLNQSLDDDQNVAILHQLGIYDQYQKYVAEIETTFKQYQATYSNNANVMENPKFQTIKSKILDIQKINSEKCSEKIEILDQTRTEIYVLEAKMHHLRQYEKTDWLKTKGYRKAQEKYALACEDLQVKTQACKDYTKQAIQEFNAQYLPLMHQRSQEMKAWKKNFKAIYHGYVQVIKQVKGELLKCRPSELLTHAQQLSSSERMGLSKAFKKDVRRELNTRIKNLSSLNFEFETNYEEVDLYRNLRSTNPVFLYLNKRLLVKVLTRAKVYQALNEVGLKNEHAYRYPHEFSGGQRQRIVIARALINNPKLIIADEPISALDVSIQAQVVNIMKRLAEQKGITFIFIAHDLSMVNYACNRMIILHNGVIVEKGDTNEIFLNPIHPYTISLIKAAPELSKIHVDLAAFSELENYARDYSPLNQPVFHQVNKNKEHFVFGTEAQIEHWTALARKARREKRKVQ